MINAKVAEMLNQQITEEFYASYLYLSMATQAQDMNLSGLAHWFSVQSSEEVMHGKKIMDYLVEQGHRVTLKAIKEPKTSWKSPLEMAKDALNHEKLVTGAFNKMMDVAYAEKDYASIAFMNWFITEQVEEESSATDLINRYEMAGDNKPAIMFIDSKLGKREE
jgi:ferritin